MKNQDLKEKLLAEWQEAKDLIIEFQTKMKELKERSVTPHGRLLTLVYAPVQNIVGNKRNSFYDKNLSEKELILYWFDELIIRPDYLINSTLGN